MGSTPVTGSNLKALRDAPLSFLDFLYKSALRAADQESFKKRFIFELYSKRVNGKVINVSCDLPNLDRTIKINETINNLHDKQADGILLVPHVNRIGLALKVAKANRQVSGQRHRNLLLLSSPTLNTEETLKDGKQDVENLTMVVPWFAKIGNLKAGKAKAFWDGRVNWRWAEAYDATLTLMEAWRNTISSNANATVSSNRKQLRETLISDAFTFPEGVTGEVKFLPGGDRQLTDNGILIQVQPVKGSRYGYDFVALETNPDKA
jgi:ABC-type branched-subunit amino acid transport system substrate-binding protein